MKAQRVDTYLMPHHHGNVLCPKCNRSGFLVKRIVKNRVQIPKIRIGDNFELSDSLDYVAKVLLRWHEEIIRFPPTLSQDEKMAGSLYKEYSKYSIHNENQVQLFESRCLQWFKQADVAEETGNIVTAENPVTKMPNFKKEIESKMYNHMERPPIPPAHLKLPSNTGKITRSSVAMLYGSIVHTVLRDIIDEYRIPKNKDESILFAKVMYSYYCLFENDDRRFYSHPVSWVKIFVDVIQHGYNAAASMNGIHGARCRKCGKPYERIFTEKCVLRIRESQYLSCKNCGASQRPEARLTPRYLKVKSKQIQKLLNYIQEYYPLYKKFLNNLVSQIQQDTEMKESFLQYFQKYVDEVEKFVFHKRQSYFIGHYDKGKKSKRKWCSLAQDEILKVWIEDKGYAALIKNSLKAHDNANDLEAVQSIPLLIDKLRKFGYPDKRMFDKVFIDGLVARELETLEIFYNDLNDMGQIGGGIALTSFKDRKGKLISLLLQKYILLRRKYSRAAIIGINYF